MTAFCLVQFGVAGRFKELKEAEKYNKVLGKPRPKELDELEEAEGNLCFWSNKFLDLWHLCQSWDGAGKIRLETVKTCCEDVRILYRPETRRIVLCIENLYRNFDRG